MLPVQGTAVLLLGKVTVPEAVAGGVAFETVPLMVAVVVLLFVETRVPEILPLGSIVKLLNVPLEEPAELLSE